MTAEARHSAYLAAVGRDLEAAARRRAPDPAAAARRGCASPRSVWPRCRARRNRACRRRASSVVAPRRSCRRGSTRSGRTTGRAWRPTDGAYRAVASFEGDTLYRTPGRRWHQRVSLGRCARSQADRGHSLFRSRDGGSLARRRQRRRPGRQSSGDLRPDTRARPSLARPRVAGAGPAHVPLSPGGFFLVELPLQPPRTDDGPVIGTLRILARDGGCHRQPRFPRPHARSRVAHRGARDPISCSGARPALALARHGGFLGRDRRRFRAERARGGDRARPGGALGARARGGRHDRRRDAHGGADAAGLPARRVLGDPPARARVAVPAQAAARASTDSSSRIPRSRSRTRSTTAPPWRCTARSTRRRRGSAPTRTPTASSWQPLARTGRRWPTTCSARCACRAIPSPTRASPRPECARRRASRARASAGVRARALFAGNAAHAMRPLESRTTAGFGLMLQLLGHAVGWPAAVGGSQAITAAMASLLRSLGGEIETGREVRSLGELASARAVLFDLTPRQILAIAGAGLPPRYRRALGRYRYGPGVFKLDYALAGPVPWTAPECRRAGTIHLGGSLEEIAEAEREVARRPPRGPAVRARRPAEPLRPDPRSERRPHAVGVLPRPERLGRRHARGDREPDRALRAGLPRPHPSLPRHGPRRAQAYNANYVGGDINGGAADFRQLWARPAARRVPYTTPDPRLFVCSSSTPPGGGVHAMCGWHAARAALHGVLR